MRFDAMFEDGTLYMVTDVNNVERHMLSKGDVVEYVAKGLTKELHGILNADDESDAFENAKAYLERFDAIEEE